MSVVGLLESWFVVKSLVESLVSTFESRKTITAELSLVTACTFLFVGTGACLESCATMIDRSTFGSAHLR